MRNTFTQSTLFNYFFGVASFALGNIVNVTATAASNETPCAAISPYWSFAFTAATTFIFPVILVVIRWRIKDRTTRKRIDKIFDRVTGNSDVEEKEKEK